MEDEQTLCCGCEHKNTIVEIQYCNHPKNKHITPDYLTGEWSTCVYESMCYNFNKSGDCKLYKTKESCLNGTEEICSDT